MLTRIRTSMTRKDDGASAVEYGLLVAGIAVAIIAAVFLLGGFMKGNFEKVGSSISKVS